MVRTAVGADDSDDPDKSWEALIRAMGPSTAAMRELARLSMSSAKSARILSAMLNPPTATIREMARPTFPSAKSARILSAMLNPPTATIREMARLTAPSEELLQALAQIGPDEVHALLGEARAISNLDATDILHRETEGLLDDPQTWTAEKKKAADGGDDDARHALNAT